eukprot:4410797-Pyramimonas_sp.AAC.1
MAGTPAQGPQPLAEFRAGKLVRDGNTMKADNRKGKVQVVHGDDSLTHLQWVDRTSGEVVDDTIVFPEEAKLQPMPNKRCYMLKFSAGAPQQPHLPSTRRLSRGRKRRLGFLTNPTQHPIPFARSRLC